MSAIGMSSLEDSDDANKSEGECKDTHELRDWMTYQLRSILHYCIQDSH